MSPAGCGNDGVNAKMAINVREGEEDPTTMTTTMTMTMMEEAIGSLEVLAKDSLTATSLPPESIGNNVNNVDEMR